MTDQATDEALHTGDDERLDLLTALRDYIENPDEDADQRADDLEAARKNLDELDALVIATIRRERAAADQGDIAAAAAIYQAQQIARIAEDIEAIRKHVTRLQLVAPPQEP